MHLRNGTVVGGGILNPGQRPAFEEGVRLSFARWTALCLAVQNEWGGPYSKDKAEQLLADTINWFYGRKEHYADELEECLDDALTNDFCVEAEDGSPAQMADALVRLHGSCLAGDAAPLQRLRETAAAAAAALASQRAAGGDGAGESSDDDDDGASGSGDDDAKMEEEDAAAPRAVPIAEFEAMQAARAGEAAAAAPPVDDDGFQAVVGKRGGRRR